VQRAELADEIRGKSLEKKQNDITPLCEKRDASFLLLCSSIPLPKTFPFPLFPLPVRTVPVTPLSNPHRDDESMGILYTD
jgi:hypothetical protein